MKAEGKALMYIAINVYRRGFFFSIDKRDDEIIYYAVSTNVNPAFLALAKELIVRH